MNSTIKVGTITNAQRSVRLLKNAGFKTQINRIANPGENDGCGYVVEIIGSSNINKAVSILNKNGIKVKGVETGDIS